MFTRKQDGTIVACSLLHVPVSDLNAADVFKVGSRWKDEKVLYNTVRTFAARSGWKACRSSTYIRCSCWRPPTPNQRLFNNGGSIRKSCKWKINLKSTKVTVTTIKKGKNCGKKNHKHVFADDVPVVISKAEYEHTGSCNPSTQQQIVQRSRSGDYIKKISDQSLFTLVTMYERTGSLPSPLVREILAAQFPRNKNVSRNHVYYMKKRFRI